VRTFRRGGRLRAVVDLRGVTKRRVRVRVRAITTRGRRVTETRVYRTCTRDDGRWRQRRWNIRS
jgi:hypothetical protein